MTLLKVITCVRVGKDTYTRHTFNQKCHFYTTHNTCSGVTILDMCIWLPPMQLQSHSQVTLRFWQHKLPLCRGIAAHIAIAYLYLKPLEGGYKN